MYMYLWLLLPLAIAAPGHCYEYSILKQILNVHVHAQSITNVRIQEHLGTRLLYMQVQCIIDAHVNELCIRIHRYSYYDLNTSTLYIILKILLVIMTISSSSS